MSEDIAPQIIRLTRGEVLEEGDYRLSFNEDGENYWRLRRSDEKSTWSCPFTEVEQLGERSWAMLNEGQWATDIIDKDNNLPTIGDVLTAISKVSDDDE